MQGAELISELPVDSVTWVRDPKKLPQLSRLRGKIGDETNAPHTSYKTFFEFGLHHDQISVGVSSKFYVRSCTNHLHVVAKSVVSAKRILVDHAQVCLLPLHQIIDHFALTSAVSLFERKSKIIPQKCEHVIVRKALKGENIAQEGMKSARLKNRLALSSIALATSPGVRSFAMVVPSESR